MPKPQPKTLPFTNSFSGGDVSKIRGVTEHYFPEKYDNLTCEVSFFEIEIKNFRQMEISATFKIKGSNNVVPNLYEDEKWKFMRTKDLLERFPEEAKKIDYPAPLFCLMLNKYLQIVDADLICNGKKAELVYDADTDMLAMPKSFPPLVEMPKNKNYIYYDKKSVVFYSDIKIEAEYKIKVILEANAATFEFAPLFPFGKVIFSKISSYCSGEYNISTKAWKVKPTEDNKFPDWFQYQLDKLSSHDMRMPHFRPALPYRGTFPLFDISDGLIKTELDKEKLLDIAAKKEIDLKKAITITDYSAIRFGFIVLIPEGKNIDVITRTIQRPLPPRIYEQIQQLPNYRDVLVEYDIFNLSHEKLRLKIETEILGFSEKETKTIFIHGIKNKNNQKSRGVLAQCPRLKKDILENLNTPERATMRCKIIDEDKKEILYEETFNVDFLSKDEMVWELSDVRSNQQYNLRDFICAWITPTDKNGLLDKIRSAAREFHPDKTLGHKNPPTLDDIRLYVKAFYEYLAKEGMNYLSQPFSSKTSGNSQRVVLPERVLENKAGNCIDLTVLFASLLEALGVYSLICLTPTHAFIGWGKLTDKNAMIFLETTAVGRQDFDTAMELGRKAFEENFTLSDGPGRVYIPNIQQIKGCYIVDTFRVRKSKLTSIRKG